MIDYIHVHVVYDNDNEFAMVIDVKNYVYMFWKYSGSDEEEKLKRWEF